VTLCDTCFLWPIRVHNPRRLDRFSIFCTAHSRISSGMPGHVLSLKIAPSHSGIWTPRNILFLYLTRAHNPNGISIGSAVFERPFVQELVRRMEDTVFTLTTSYLARALTSSSIAYEKSSVESARQTSSCNPASAPSFDGASLSLDTYPSTSSGCNRRRSEQYGIGRRASL